MNENKKRKNSLCFTGHRPEKLDVSENTIKAALLEEVMKSIDEGFNIFITGMARGVDMWAAEIVVHLKEKYPQIKLVAAIPYEGFERQWSQKYKEPYGEILSKADCIKYLCPKFSYISYQIRNQWMVDNSSKVIAVWNGSKGGTKNTIDYAKKCNIEVINIY